MWKGLCGSYMKWQGFNQWKPKPPVAGFNIFNEFSSTLANWNIYMRLFCWTIQILLNFYKCGQTCSIGFAQMREDVCVYIYDYVLASEYYMSLGLCIGFWLILEFDYKFLWMDLFLGVSLTWFVIYGPVRQLRSSVPRLKHAKLVKLLLVFMVQL